MNLLKSILNPLSSRTSPNPAEMELDDLRAHNNALRSRFLGLSAKLAERQLETAQMRRMMRRQVPGHDWIAERATVDVLGLYILQTEGILPSRQNARNILHMSTRRWQWARALARLANVHNGHVFDENIDPRVLVAIIHDKAAYAARHHSEWKRYRAR